MISFSVNKVDVEVEAPDDTPLLWVLRDRLGLTGTKFGCGVAQCGACTVHVDGQARRSCVTPVASVAGSAVTTIEGLAATAGDGGERRSATCPPGSPPWRRSRSTPPAAR